MEILIWDCFIHGYLISSNFALAVASDLIAIIKIQLWIFNLIICQKQGQNPWLHKKKRKDKLMNRNFNKAVNDQWKYFQTVISCILNSRDLCSAVTYYIILLYIYVQI